MVDLSSSRRGWLKFCRMRTRLMFAHQTEKKSRAFNTMCCVFARGLTTVGLGEELPINVTPLQRGMMSLLKLRKRSLHPNRSYASAQVTLDSKLLGGWNNTILTKWLASQWEVQPFSKPSKVPMNWQKSNWKNWILTSIITLHIPTELKWSTTRNLNTSTISTAPA